MHNNIENLTPENLDRWNSFVAAVNDLVTEHFGVGEAAVLVGGSFGPLSIEEDQPVVLVSSNLPICQQVNMADEVLAFTVNEHEWTHEQANAIAESSDAIRQEISADVVPEEIRELAEAWAKENGFNVEDVRFTEIVDGSDLSDPFEALGIEES